MFLDKGRIIMNLEKKVLQILGSKDYISGATYIENKTKYRKRNYKYIYKFVLMVESSSFNMVLGIPRGWNKALVDIYFEEVEKVPFIPHLEKLGNICLFDTEGALIELDFYLILNDCLNRMYKIVYEGLTEQNKKDFITEFSAYWGKLPSLLFVHADIELEKKTKNISIIKLRKGTKHHFASDKKKDFIFREFVRFENETVNNGIYIYIDSDTFVYPPDWRYPLEIEYIHRLLKHKSIDRKVVLSFLTKRNQWAILIFNISQPNETTTLFGVELEDYEVDKDLLEVRAKNIYPLYIERWDDDYLVNRGGAISNFKERKIFIIGCGSIGGYLISELVKSGFKNLTFTDYDCLSKENIYRHILGVPFLYRNKAQAMKQYITQNIPHIKANICYYTESIETLLEKDDNLFRRYDLIISAVGNHNLNRWINRYTVKNKIDTPVIYGWNEALGIGSHAAFISREYPGCYECFFKKEENTGIVYDKTSFSEKGQIFSKKMRGCSSSYIPFGSGTSITTVLAIIGLVKKFFEKRIGDNILKSIKGDSYYMEEEGYLLSPKYKAQENKEQDYLGVRFINSECGVCSNEK